MNKFNYLRNRFQDMMKIYLGSDINGFKECLYFIDWLFALLIQGASIFDYFAYSFYKKRINGRNE